MRNSPLRSLLFCAATAAVIPAIADDTLHVGLGFHGVDTALGLVLVHDPELVRTGLEPGTVVLLPDFGSVHLPAESVPSGIPGSYLVHDTAGAELLLFFTDLPLVHIAIDTLIVSADRRPAEFSIHGGGPTWRNMPIGISKRGAASLAWPKNNLRIEFMEQHGSSSTVNVALLGMRSDDDWNLQAFYNEPLRMRSNLTQRLWMDVHTPHYAGIRPDAEAGVAMAYVEVFTNGRYQGLHGLSERVDRKQLKLHEYAGMPRGAIFQAKHWTPGTLFEGLDPMLLEEGLWSGFEQKYPEVEDLWNDLRALVGFVVQAEDDLFRARYPEHLAQGNLVDYFLFMNLLRAWDNRGKNLFLARYDHDAPWFIVPWDLDAVLGLDWEGNLDNGTQGVLSNGLFDRLLEDCAPNGFVALLRARWAELRAEQFTSDAIMARFRAQYAQLADAGVYVRESMAWPEYVHRPEELERMERWLDRRLRYLDAAFVPYCMTTDVTQIQQVALRAWPNPASGSVTVALPRSEAWSLRLMDVLGRELRSWQGAGAETVLPLTGIAAGEYILLSDAVPAHPLRLLVR